jgi:hypothetical protein
LTSCKNQTNETIDKQEIKSQVTEIPSKIFILNKLPESKSNPLNNSHICFDVYDNQKVNFSVNIQSLDISYTTFMFDTLINGTKLIYSYRILGVEGNRAVNKRIFDCIKDDFQSMAETATLEPKRTCYYSILTDSIIVSKSNLIYTRYTALTVGGAGAMESSKKYELSTSELRKILMDSELIVDENYLKQYLIEERYF